MNKTTKKQHTTVSTTSAFIKNKKELNKTKAEKKEN
jgi:hypothetical protein